MATSLVFKSANPSATNDDMSAPKMVVTVSENATTETIKKQPRSWRPSSKTQPPNKQRRRGLGVAELERLSIQDSWKKMTEIPQLQVSSTGQFFTAPTDFHIQPPFNLDATHQAPPYGLQGYCMTRRSPPARPFPGFVVPAVLAEASRELTSMPNNAVQQQQQCRVLLDSCCSKKKGISKRSSTRKKMMDSHGHFLELNLGNYNDAGQSWDAVNCCDEKEVEVMASGRKLKKKNNSSPSSSMGVRNSRRLVLEYEFFPGKANRSSLIPQESSYALHSSIDLSLKLSTDNTNY